MPAPRCSRPCAPRQTPPPTSTSSWSCSYRDSQAGPPDAWLVVDDYQHVTMSEAAESVIEGLALDSPVQLVVLSRLRPAWASTRRVLYGEVLDLDQHALSFTEAESNRVLGGDIRPLADLAQGWPAIVGLAARTGQASPPRRGLPEELYDFLADELYEGSPPEVQDSCLRLAVCPTLDRDSVEVVLGTADSAGTVELCVRLDFLQRDRDGSLDMHPLLRSFLIEKARRSAREDLETQVPRELGLALLRRGRWADVFALHELYPGAELFIALLEVSLDRPDRARTPRNHRPLARPRSRRGHSTSAR